MKKPTSLVVSSLVYEQLGQQVRPSLTDLGRVVGTCLVYQAGRRPLGQVRTSDLSRLHLLQRLANSIFADLAIKDGAAESDQDTKTVFPTPNVQIFVSQKETGDHIILPCSLTRENLSKTALSHSASIGHA
ncbi:hypothetical protein NC653_009764 [Populus alba x Populus x berolinensis]|uniref:Uncharacterized protein n=1 Tax=Populus alba x Populus x berolinensis TaxID=444605 RepID=A0AAD6WA40_9ROSI|nr:hypothetical protein NC653_009764 [Populus alba x Populus x berolinensis]